MEKVDWRLAIYRNITCPLALDEDGMDNLLSGFKETYLVCGGHDMQGQIPFLSQLAEHYESLGISPGSDWTHLLKVSVYIHNFYVNRYDFVSMVYELVELLGTQLVKLVRGEG